MKNKKPPRSRNARAHEIDSKIRSAGDYLGLMMQHEVEASESATGPPQDLERQAEAHRKFARDYHAFLSVATVAWNYMNQAADAAGTRDWLDKRLSSNLFKFHRALENQAKHDYEVVVGVNQKVRYEAEPDTPMIRSAVGVMPARATITGFEGMTFHHKSQTLSPTSLRCAKACSRNIRTKRSSNWPADT